MAEEPRPFRHFPRLSIEIGVLVRKAGGESSEILATTRSVSSGGCMLVHDQGLGVGSPLELLISLPGRVIKAQGQVVWENERASGEVEMGIEFLRMNSEDRRILEATIATTASTQK